MTEVKETSQTEYVRCLHGLLYQTCMLCREKDVEKVQKEVLAIRNSRIAKSSYEAQGIIETKQDEQDRDYDIDMG
mgnify:CR=1 FL=1